MLFVSYLRLTVLVMILIGLAGVIVASIVSIVMTISPDDLVPIAWSVVGIAAVVWLLDYVFGARWIDDLERIAGKPTADRRRQRPDPIIRTEAPGP